MIGLAAPGSFEGRCGMKRCDIRGIQIECVRKENLRIIYGKWNVEKKTISLDQYRRIVDAVMDIVEEETP